MANDVENTLGERAKTHGDYKQQACTAQAIKRAMRSAPNWPSLQPCMQESLELIATKVSRILHGDPYHEDSWHDIAGYAKLITRE